MPQYKVNMARVTWLVAKVDADNEDEALEKAHEVVPEFSAPRERMGLLGLDRRR